MCVFVCRQQELSNLLQEKKYRKALGLAISLDQPYTVLTVIKGTSATAPFPVSRINVTHRSVTQSSSLTDKSLSLFLGAVVVAVVTAYLPLLHMPGDQRALTVASSGEAMRFMLCIHAFRTVSAETAVKDTLRVCVCGCERDREGWVARCCHMDELKNPK